MVAALGMLLPFGGQIYIGGVALTTAAGSLTLAGSLLNIGASLALQAATKPGTPAAPRPENIQINTKQTAGVRMAHVGRVKVGGNVVFHRARAGDAYRIIVHGHGRADAIEAWYLNNDPVTLDANGWVTTPQYVVSGVPKVRIQHRLGLVPSAGYADLTAVRPEWTADHRLDGQVTTLIRSVAVNAAWWRAVYPRDEPEVQVVMRGQRFADPRAGGAVVWTENAALIIAGYIASPDGLGRPDAVDPDDLIAEANLADQAVALATGGTEARWRLSGSYALTEQPQDVLRRMLDATAGRMRLRPSGKVGLRLGSRRAPQVVIRYADLADAPVTVEFGPDKLDRYNTLPGRYVDHGLGFQEVDADAWVNAAQLAATGEDEVGTAQSLLMSPSHRQTRQVLRIVQARENPALRLRLSVKPGKLEAAFEDEVTLDIPELGLSGEFEVSSHDVAIDRGKLGIITLNLIAVEAAAYGLSLGEQGSVQTVPEADTPAGVPVPQDVVAVGAGVRVSGNTWAAGIAVAWSPPPSTALESVVRWRPHAVGAYQDYPVGSGVEQVQIAGPLVDLAYYDVQVAWRTPAGVIGVAVTLTHVQAVAATTDPAPPTGLTVTDLGGGDATVALVASTSTDLWKTEVRRDGVVILTSYAEPGAAIALTDSCGAGTYDWTARSINVSARPSLTDAGPVTETIT